MNIQPIPPVSVSAVAGTQRAAAKSGQNDATASAAAAAQQKAENPGGVAQDISEIEKDAPASDGDADGRQLFQADHDGVEDSEDSESDHAHRSVNDDFTGQHIDFDA